MKIIKKIYRCLKTALFTVISKFVICKYGKPNVKNSVETVEYIINNIELCVSRFGDGEFDLMEGKSIKFQEYDENLVNSLKEILKNDNKNLMVCIPCIYNNKVLKTLTFNSKSFWIDYIVYHHSKYINYIDLNTQYYDASFTRFYIRYNMKHKDISVIMASKIKEIWNEKNILIVEGEFSRLGVGNDLFANTKSIKRILCPSKNAYSKYTKIFESIKKSATGGDILVILSLGPTATVLANDLSKCGIRAIDLGHIDLEYEWFLRKVEDKILIKNKIVNEINDNQKINNIEDKEYKDSIIEVIK